MDLRAWLSEFRSETDVRAQHALKELRFILSKMKDKPLSLIGVAMLMFVISIASLAPVLAPPSLGVDPFIIPYEGPPARIIAPLPTGPSASHPFGTLNGYDLYYGCIWGTLTAFRISLLVILGALLIGLFIGSVAGYYGGLVDIFMMRFTDIFFAIPNVLLALVLFVAWPSSLPVNLGFANFEMSFTLLDKLILVLMLVKWPFYARLIRGEIIKIKHEDYVEAATAMGCSGRRVMIKHILPNSIYPVLIMAFLDIGGVVLAASTLSFLGLGPRTGYADWGAIINSAQNFILGSPQEPFRYFYTFFYPALFISIFIMAWALLGDTLRDVLDPTMRRV